MINDNKFYIGSFVPFNLSFIEIEQLKKTKKPPLLKRRKVRKNLEKLVEQVDQAIEELREEGYLKKKEDLNGKIE